MSTVVVDFRNNSTRASAAKKELDVERCIIEFLGNNSNKMKVIGLDTEWSLDASDSKPLSKAKAKNRVAILQLCDGESCLIVQLPHFVCIPNCLFNFLRMQEYTFVGIGIKESVAKLGEEYGLECRNALELGPLAAAALREPCLADCGVDEIAVSVDCLWLEKPSSVVFCDWGVENLSKAQIIYATSNAYACFRIGIKLLPLYPR